LVNFLFFILNEKKVGSLAALALCVP